MTRRKATPETRLKRAATVFLKRMGIFSYHITQGMGSYAGLPDRVAHHKGQVFYLEFKAPNGRLSKGQVAFQEQCKRDGIQYHVIRSIGDIERALKIPNLFT